MSEERYSKLVSCPSCKGAGRKPGYYAFMGYESEDYMNALIEAGVAKKVPGSRCNYCGGTGQVRYDYTKGDFVPPADA